MKILSSCTLTCFLKPIWHPFFCQTPEADIYSKIQAALFHSMKVNDDHQERFSRHETLSVCSSHKISIYLVHFYYGWFFLELDSSWSPSTFIVRNRAALTFFKRKKENIHVWNDTRVSKWLWWQSLISNVLTISSRDQERHILSWIVHDRLFSACLAWFKSLAETIKANSSKQREKWGTKKPEVFGCHINSQVSWTP